MSENTQKQEVTINDPVKGLTFTQKECGADSIYAGFKIWVKEADTIDAAAADSGASANPVKKTIDPTLTGLARAKAARAASAKP